MAGYTIIFHTWINSIRGKIHTNPILLALSRLAQDSMVYLIGAVLVGVGNIFLVPLYIRSLTPAEFGIYSLLEITVFLLVLLSQLGLGVTYLKVSAEMESSRRGEILGSALLMGSSTALTLGSLLVLFVRSPLGESWLQSGDRNYAWVLLPVVVLETIQSLLFSDLRASRRAGSYSIVSVSRLLIMAGASLWLIVILKLGVGGIFLGRLAGDLTSVALLLILCLPKTRLQFSKSMIQSMVRYGLPLVWSALMATMLDASGRFFLNRFSTLEQVGYYGAAIKISSIIQVLIAQPFGIAWGGLLFQIQKWPEARAIYSKILAYVAAVSLVVTLLFAILTPVLFKIFATSAYSPAMAVFPVILLARAFNILEYPTSVGLYLGGKTKWFALIYSIGLGINFLVNLLLVPVFGMFGSACAWFLAWLVITGLMAWLGQRYYPLAYDWQFLVFPAAAWAVFGLIQIFLPNSPSLPLLNITLALLCIAGFAFLFVQDISKARNKTVLEI